MSQLVRLSELLNLNTFKMLSCEVLCILISPSRWPDSVQFEHMARRSVFYRRISIESMSRIGKRFLRANPFSWFTKSGSAYWLTVTNQRWLGVRLDILGNLLTFSVAILAVSARFTISPSLTGLVLSYILTVQQAFGWLVRQSAEVENDMNSVERILHYSHQIEQEAPHQLPDHKPLPEWPSSGQITLDNIVLRYRPGLPAVLKNLSLNIKGGEKIGVVGR